MNDKIAIVLLTVSLIASVYGMGRTYMVIDVSSDSGTFPVTYLDTVPPGGWTQEYKTSKIVLRKVEAGSFTMGCSTNEVGSMKYLQEPPYSFDAVQHRVSLSKMYYIGVFEVTQRQWEYVMGTRPSWFSKNADYATRPVENISYQDIRGVGTLPSAVAVTNVNEASFIGILRKKTPL